MRAEEMIAELTTGLRPVRRMAAPGWQALGWIAFAVAVIGGTVALDGLRHDIDERMALPFDVAQWVTSVIAGSLAALAAAMLARPDRSWRWGLLPLPFAVLWVSSLGMGCMSDMARMGPAAMELHTSWPCAQFILSIGIPLTLAQLWVLRHAGPTRPVPVLLLGGFAAAALCSAGLSLVHHLDAALMILVWHGGSMIVLMLLGWLCGWRLLRQPQSVS